MTIKATTTCDGVGCGAVQESDKGWRNVTRYQPYETDHYCPACWVKKAPDAEAIRALDAARASDAILIADVTAKAVREERRANELNDLLAKARIEVSDLKTQRERDWNVHNAAAKKIADRVQELEVELSNARDESEFATKDVVELLGMVGKKARKRHNERIAVLEREYFVLRNGDALVGTTSYEIGEGGARKVAENLRVVRGAT